MRIFRSLATLSLAALMVVGLLPTAAADEPTCKTVSGFLVCGDVTASICAGSAEGTSTGSVAWKFVVTSSPGSTASHESTGIAYANTLTTACYTSGCTTATLYADGVVIDSEGICW